MIPARHCPRQAMLKLLRCNRFHFRRSARHPLRLQLRLLSPFLPLKAAGSW